MNASRDQDPRKGPWKMLRGGLLIWGWYNTFCMDVEEGDIGSGKVSVRTLTREWEEVGRKFSYNYRWMKNLSESCCFESCFLKCNDTNRSLNRCSLHRWTNAASRSHGLFISNLNNRCGIPFHELLIIKTPPKAWQSRVYYHFSLSWW